MTLPDIAKPVVGRARRNPVVDAGYARFVISKSAWPQSPPAFGDVFFRIASELVIRREFALRSLNLDGQAARPLRGDRGKSRK